MVFLLDLLINRASWFDAPSSSWSLGFFWDIVWIGGRLAFSRRARRRGVCCRFPANHYCHLTFGLESLPKCPIF
jgi:hypothetical protein